jgi:hypothetical protein
LDDIEPGICLPSNSLSDTARDEIAVGVLGVDAGLIASAIPLRAVLGHDWWQLLIVAGVSGLLALAALLQAGLDLGPTPSRVYELSSGLTEEDVVLRLVVLLDAAIARANRCLTIKAALLTGSLLVIVSVPLTITLSSL